MGRYIPRAQTRNGDNGGGLHTHLPSVCTRYATRYDMVPL